MGVISNCSVRNLKVKNLDSAMHCELCEEWRHIKCDDVKIETYQALKDDKINDQRVHYFCSGCNDKAAKAIKLMMCTKKRMDKMEQEMTELKQETGTLKAALKDVKAYLYTAFFSSPYFPKFSGLVFQANLIP